MNKIFYSLLTALLFIGTLHAQRSAVFVDNGKAIRGYDPVAFFTEGKALMGKDSFSYQWQSATWTFNKKENRELFIAEPEKYAPQFGGYCAYGMAEAHKAPTKTNTWTIVDGKLYFNYNKQVQQAWMKDQASLIQEANKHWPGIKDNQ